MESLKILAVDDDDNFLTLLCKFLSTQPGLEVVGKATSGEEAISMYGTLSPDVVLMDLVMPGMDGMTSTRKIKESDPSARVIVLTVHNAIDYMKQSEKAGADAYVLKGTASRELVSTIKKVISEPPHQIMPD